MSADHLTLYDWNSALALMEEGHRISRLSQSWDGFSMALMEGRFVLESPSEVVDDYGISWEDMKAQDYVLDRTLVVPLRDHLISGGLIRHRDWSPGRFLAYDSLTRRVVLHHPDVELPLGMGEANLPYFSSEWMTVFHLQPPGASS